MAEALVNSLAPAGNLYDMLMAETQVPGIKATDDLITTLTRLAISHDRQLQTLEDRHTIIALIYGQQEKAKVRGIRDEWQRQKPRQRSIASLWCLAAKCYMVADFGHSTTAVPRADHESSNRRTPSGQIRGTAGTARITWLRHCIRSSQPVLRSYQQARCTPYSRGGKNCISPPAQAPEPDGRGRQAMGVDTGVGPVSVLSNNQRCRDCSLVRCKAVGDQVATSFESGRPSCKTACCTKAKARGKEKAKHPPAAATTTEDKTTTRRNGKEAGGTIKKTGSYQARWRVVQSMLLHAFPRQADTRSLLQRATASRALAGALAVRSGFWPCRRRRGGCSWRQSAALTTLGSLMLQETSPSFPEMVSLWPTYPPTHSTTSAGLHRRALCVRKRLGIPRPTENTRRSTCPPFSWRSRLCCPCSLQHASREP